MRAAGHSGTIMSRPSASTLLFTNVLPASTLSNLKSSLFTGGVQPLHILANVRVLQPICANKTLIYASEYYVNNVRVFTILCEWICEVATLGIVWIKLNLTAEHYSNKLLLHRKFIGLLYDASSLIHGCSIERFEVLLNLLSKTRMYSNGDKDISIYRLEKNRFLQLVPNS